MARHVYRYRCPRCHHIVPEEQLFEKGCPICGWASPLGPSKTYGNVSPSDETIADVLSTGMDLRSPNWKRKCPNCGEQQEEKEPEKGYFLCGWPVEQKPKKERMEKDIIVERAAEREALVDVFEGPNHIEVVIGAPDITERNVEVEIDPEGRKLVVWTHNKGYRREIDLPCPVASEPVVFSKHGVLDIMVKKRAD